MEIFKLFPAIALVGLNEQSPIAEGKLVESEAIRRESLAVGCSVRGNENTSTLDTMGVLADTLGQQEKSAESNPLSIARRGTMVEGAAFQPSIARPAPRSGRFDAPCSQAVRS